MDEFGRKHETREQQRARHAEKAAAISAHRQKIRAELEREANRERSRLQPKDMSFLCPLKFNNECVGGCGWLVV